MEYEIGTRLDVLIEGLREVTNKLDVLLLLFKEADPIKYKKVIDEINETIEKKKEEEVK